MKVAGSLKIVSARERPDLAERAGERAGDVWPEYNKHGDVVSEYWSRLDEVFPDFQFVLHDEEDDEVLAEGHSIPCSWDGTVAGLPDGIDGVIAGGFRLREHGEAPTTLSALAIVILPEHRNRGLSRVMVDAMGGIAAEHGFANLIAPVRPSWKERYPLTPVERYVRWTRDDGLPFDPWLRVHHRLGGKILRPEPQSLRISGTVAEWEGWTEMRFPESGEYVFPNGLAPVVIEREADSGIYFEPNVWMRHRATTTATRSRT
jgi:GNAT superfamily N-acetyltransferase